MKYSKYNNIFNYYRGPSSKKQVHQQIENNTTKALINTLMYISERQRIAFLNQLGYFVDGAVYFEQQPYFKTSQPDALIRGKGNEIYIESKVQAPLDIEQIRRHLENIGDANLLVITNRASDEEELRQFDRSLLQFKTWSDIYTLFNNLEDIKNKTDKFIIQQFLEYLEDNNMNHTFNGWKQKDFDAFLFVENDENSEQRKNVKERLNSFLEQVSLGLKNNKVFGNHTLRPQTNISKDATSIWCNLVQQGKDNVKIAHIFCDVHSNGISIGINNQGKTKTATSAFIENLEKEEDTFTEICQKLDGVYIRLNKRYHIRVSKWDAYDIAKIRLGKDYTKTDTVYLKNKIKDFEAIEVTVIKDFKRDYKNIDNLSFINDCVSEIEKLEDFYKFNLKK